LQLKIPESTFTFVDLAGSEKYGGDPQTIFINKSLTALGKCVN
jgi:hypothetical protein